MRIRDITHVAKGALTYLPPVSHYRRGRQGGGATASAAYCYAVWLRHLLGAAAAGLSGVPVTVAELGPGDSIGVGLAALLSGAEVYVGLDLMPFASGADLGPLLEQLIDLFQRRAPIPGQAAFPDLRPLLRETAFPAALLPGAWLARCLAPDRLAELRAAVRRPLPGASGPLRYVAPWTSIGIVAEASVDFILSQAVLEHVDDLGHALRSMGRWLRAGGHSSHVVDFRSHGLASDWNGHYGYPDLLWRLVRGRREYAINRVPLSRIRALAAETGFTEVHCQRERGERGLTRPQLAGRWHDLSEEDLSTCGAHVIWRKG